MIKIDKNEEPREWTEYRMTPGVDYKAIPELVESLLDEQGYICAYCMRRIPTRDKYSGKDGKQIVTDEDHRIEHIKSREKHDDLKLNYNNMVICCPGHIGNEEHCDRLKSSDDISFSPLDPNFIATIRYKSDGTIISTDGVCNKEMNEKLNLNTYLLRRGRKETWNAVVTLLNRKRGKNTAWDRNMLLRCLEKYSNRHMDDGRRMLYPYCGIVIWNINRRLRAIK